jgi:AbrB family looped-hinge helix DNA binding protein
MTSYQTVVSSKGQVVIPAPLREKLGLAQGTRAHWIEEDGRLVLAPISEKRIDELMGILKPKPGQPSMLETLRNERKREREREDGR